MKVIRVQRGFFKDTVILKANKFKECYMETLFGTKIYWVNNGTKVQINYLKTGVSK